jgi:hypothetical protein
VQDDDGRSKSAIHYFKLKGTQLDRQVSECPALVRQSPLIHVKTLFLLKSEFRLTEALSGTRELE